MNTSCTFFTCVCLPQAYVQEHKTQKVYHHECGWYFDNLHCNTVGRDPQAKLAKPNWRSDSIAGT